MKTQFASFGFLRLGLIGLSIVSMLIHIIEWMTVQMVGELAERSLLALSANLIAPVMAPTLVIVLLLDVIIAKVRAADDSTSSGDLYRMISRFDTLLIIVMLLFWVPYFVFLVS